MLVYPDIDPIIFSLGPLKVRWYGLMYIVGFAIAWFLLTRRARANPQVWSKQDPDDLVFYGALGLIIGARVFSVFVYGFDKLLEDPWSALRIWEGGMSFHGGLIGVMIAMWWFGRKKGIGFFATTDFLIPAVPLGLAAGRIGNFINGELWGKPTTVPWGFQVGDQVLHPSQLYEALLEGVVLFIILWTFSAKPRPVRAASGVFLVGYGVFRFAVEFVRVPDLHIGYLAFDWLTMGQILSAPMIVAGVWLLVTAYRNKVYLSAADPAEQAA